MTYSIALLSLLIPAVIAIPKFSHQPRGPTGFPTGAPHGTGASAAPYGQLNSTLVGPTGTGFTSTAVVTIVPLPGSTVVVTEGAASKDVGTAPIVDSSDGTLPIVNSSDGPKKPSPVENKGGERPKAAFQNPDTCGPATITVTEENTVTVTVDAVPASSSPIAPVPALSDDAGPSQTDAETTSAGPINRLPTPQPLAPKPKHGHNHSKFHHKSAASSRSSSVAAEPEPEPTAASSPLAPVITVSVTPVAAKKFSSEVSSNTPAVTPKVNLAYPAPKVPESSTAPPPVSHSPVEASTPEPKSSSPSVPSSSSEPEPKPSAPSTPASPGTKRGLVYNTAALTETFSSSPAISWCYNWDSQPGGSIPSNFNFVPMMWGPLPVHTGHWKSNADTAIAAGSTHLLGFNEPDLPDQANLTPEQAAEAWHEYLEPYAGKAKLGSPAVCNGDGKVGLNWLAKFLEACSGCTIDFIAIHWYGLANDDGVGFFKEHVGKAVNAAGGRPVWITEFQPNGSPEEQARWLEQILPWLDDESQSGVERYSYYQVDNILVSGDSLTELGKKYAS